MLLEIFLFIVFFCFYCCLVPTTSTEEQDSFDTFIPAIKEAFSEEFDPTLETIKTTETIEEPTNSRPMLCLPPGKSRYHNQVKPITNSVLTVPPTANKSYNLSVNPESLTYKELKEFVKIHNLQTTVKDICGKSYNRCRKKELIEALKS